MMGGIIGELFIHPLDISIEVDTKDLRNFFVAHISEKNTVILSG